MTIFLKALGIRYYRGIGDDAQLMGPFRGFNFFIGANNSGKSTVLSFLASHLATSPIGDQSRRTTRKTGDLDGHIGKKSGDTWSAVGLPVQDFLAALAPNHRVHKPHLLMVANAISQRGIIWVHPGAGSDSARLAFPPESQKLVALMHDYEWQRLWTGLTDTRGGSMRQWIEQSIAILLQAQKFEIPSVDLIPAIREIGAPGSDFNFSGGGVIERLAQIQSPDFDRQADRDTFNKINSFVRVVTGKPHATIEVPHNRQHLLVHIDGKVLPLSSLGTGLHEVIMLAAFCTITRGHIVCIEEPEIHLHPVLQRKLIAHLAKETDNQYFIATHSAAFIDTPGAAIFHVTNDGDQTRISESILRSQRVDLCVDLGYRASDIVQSNFVVWVEGPSDRIYVKHWIAALDVSLIEGIHYSIMFYGGRLLNHLSADSEELDEFISLRSLNQHLAVVIDSDRKAPKAHVNATKQKIKVQLDAADEQLCWITQGREIENYVPHDALQAAVKAVYGEVYDRPADGSAYEHALHFYRQSAKRRRKGPATDDLLERDVDKVRVAREVCKHPADLSVLDLKARVTALVALIQRAND